MEDNPPDTPFTSTHTELFDGLEDLSIPAEQELSLAYAGFLATVVVRLPTYDNVVRSMRLGYRFQHKLRGRGLFTFVETDKVELNFSVENQKSITLERVHLFGTQVARVLGADPDRQMVCFIEDVNDQGSTPPETPETPDDAGQARERHRAWHPRIVQ